MPLRAYLARLPALLRRERNLSWFLVARGFGTLATMAGGFYTVYALRAWHVPDWQVGVFTTLLLAGQMLGNLTLGWLADHAGHRLVLALGLAALAAGNVVALAADSVDALGLVFALSGVHIASLHISSRTILLELAPESERPTYIGLANTALAPLTFAAPLAAGVMADRLGFPAIFATAATLSGIGLAVLLARVRDPRALARG
jgi:MFS family permease